MCICCYILDHTKYNNKYEIHLLLYKNILISYLCGGAIYFLFDFVFGSVFEIVLNMINNMITN